jgi:hypothetical protein
MKKHEEEEPKNNVAVAPPTMKKIMAVLKISPELAEAEGPGMTKEALAMLKLMWEEMQKRENEFYAEGIDALRKANNALQGLE